MATRRLDPWLLAILLIASPLYLYALDRPIFWQDEAEQALHARRILETGLPLVGEGAERISQEEGIEAGWRGLQLYHGFLPIYVTAASFAVFGESTWAGRIPFALCGLLVVVLTYALARHRLATARLAAALVAFSVPFILHARQCRYYAITALGLAAVLLAYRRLLGRKRGARWQLALAGSALALTHDVVFLSASSALGAHMLLWERGDRGLWTRFLTSLVAPVILCGGWLALTTTSGRYLLVRRTSFEASLSYFLAETNAHLLPWPLLAIPLLALALCGRRGNPWEDAAARDRRSLAALLFMTAVMVILSTSLIYPHFRVLVPLAPAAAVAAALCLEPLLGGGRRAAKLGCVAIAGLLLLTDLPRLVAEAPFRAAGWLPAARHASGMPPFPLASLAARIHEDRPGPVATVIEHLHDHAGAGDSILTSYGDLPLRFYTDLIVYGGRSGVLPPPGVRPDWIWIRARTRALHAILRKQGVEGANPTLAALRWTLEHADPDAYETYRLPVNDRNWEHRPDPDLFFLLPERAAPAVQLMRRRDEPRGERRAPPGPVLP